MNVYKDEFMTTFSDVMDFLHFINRVEINSKWFKDKCKNISFEALIPRTEMAENLENEYKEKGIVNIIENTISNTGLILKLDDTPYLVRDCAVKSILARAKINGNALTKVDTSTLAKILNYCMNVANGNALFRFSEEKISAVHSANESDYSILNLPELFSRTNDYLQFTYNNCNFMDAAFSHSLTSALWSVDDKSLKEIYDDLLNTHKVEHGEIVPAVRLTTSDIGISSATLFPILLMGDRKIPTVVGDLIKLEHKNGATIDDFEFNLSLLYSTFQAAISNIADLLNIKIKNPVNCMIGVIKKIGLPKKYSLEAVENFKELHDESEVTAYDIYLGISEVIFIMQCAKCSPTQIINTEEMIARALSIRWKDYDTSIDPKW